MKKNLDNCPKCGNKFEIDTENLKTAGCYILSGDIDALVECGKCGLVKRTKLFLPIEKRKKKVPMKEKLKKVSNLVKKKKKFSEETEEILE